MDTVIDNKNKVLMTFTSGYFNNSLNTDSISLLPLILIFIIQLVESFKTYSLVIDRII